MSESVPSGWPRRIWVPTMVLAGVYLVGSFTTAVTTLTGGEADAAAVVGRYMIAPVLFTVGAWAAACVLALGWTGAARGRAGNLWMLALIVLLAGRHVVRAVRDEPPEVPFQESGQQQIEARQEEGSDAVGETQIAGHAMASALLTLDRPRAELAAALGEFVSAGGIDASDVRTREDLARRLEIARRHDAASRAFTEAQASLDETVEQALADAGLSAEFQANLLRGFRSGREVMERHLAERRLDDRFAALAVELFELLDEAWASWRYDASDNTLVFDDAETGERYAGILNEMDTVNSQRDALREQP